VAKMPNVEATEKTRPLASVAEDLSVMALIVDQRPLSQLSLLNTPFMCDCQTVDVSL